MFNRALKIVLKHEGGWVHHKDDPGGETNFGITRKVAEQHGYRGDMRSIPMDVVQRIYRTSYWDKVKGDSLPWPVALVVFDAAVNSGVSRASKWLQKAVGTAQDGVIGPGTLKALSGCRAEDVAKAVCDTRLAFLRGLGTWQVFGRGWERRVRETLAEALS